MKKYIKLASNLLFIPPLLISLLVIGCFNQSDTPQVDHSDSDYQQNEKIKQDNVKVDDNIGAYTYIIEPEDMIYPVVEPKEIRPEDKAMLKNDSMVSHLDSSGQIALAPIHIRVSSKRDEIKSDRPPLFDKECLSAEYPVKCSSDKLRNYIRENLDLPEEALAEGHDGVEIVTFKVTKNGKLKDLIIERKAVACAGCREAVEGMIQAMPNDWAPALIHGDPVTAKVTVPIYFETI